MYKIAVISHTEHYSVSSKLGFAAWGATVKELDKLAESCDELIHIAPYINTVTPKSAVTYKNKKVKYIALKPSGGKTIISKLSILYNIPSNLYRIHKAIKGVDYIQFRAPTSIGLYVLPYLLFFAKVPYWVKYAGNWVADKMPTANKLQILWLKNIEKKNTKITLNGIWPDAKLNMLPFENPCLDDVDRKLGLDSINNKLLNKVNFCFVGALHQFKGVHKIIEVFNNLDHQNIGEINIVGDGPEREQLQIQAKGGINKINFLGFLPKDETREVYQKSHVVILASETEGFPKVIAEGMNFGCIPIVSDISCLSQYILDGENGFLLNPITSNVLKSKIEQVLNMDTHRIKQIFNKNYHSAQKFTYDYYINRLKKEVLI